MSALSSEILSASPRPQKCVPGRPVRDRIDHALIGRVDLRQCPFPRCCCPRGMATVANQWRLDPDQRRLDRERLG